MGERTPRDQINFSRALNRSPSARRSPGLGRAVQPAARSLQSEFVAAGSCDPVVESETYRKFLFGLFWTAAVTALRVAAHPSSKGRRIMAELANLDEKPRSNGAAYLRQPQEAELRWMGETCTYFLAEGSRTQDAFSLVDEQAKRGEAVPRHRHERDMESFYVLSGEITFYIGDQPGIRAKPGAFVHLPGGTVHGFRIESETARYLILTTPRHGEFYRAITLPAQPGGAPPTESVTGATVERACREFGVEFVGPLPEPC